MIIQRWKQKFNAGSKLTGQGWILLDTVVPAYPALNAEQYAVLSDGEQKQLSGLLQKLEYTMK